MSIEYNSTLIPTMELITVVANETFIYLLWYDFLIDLLVQVFHLTSQEVRNEITVLQQKHQII